MSKNQVAVLTAAFPQNDSFVDDYFLSLSRQSYKNFDILLLNDGIHGLDRYRKKYSNLNIIEISGLGNIAKNRELLIGSALKASYVKAVFADFDDYCSDNRIEVVSNYLDDYDLVVNDLTLVAQGQVCNGSLFCKALSDTQEVNIDAVLESNFLGMSNVGIRLGDLPGITFEENLTAVDWYFFSRLLLADSSAIYTSQCKTYYRQHLANTANIGRVTLEQLRLEISVKKQHYSLMLKYSPKYQELLSAVIDFSGQPEDFVIRYFDCVQKDITSPFWWNIFNEKNYWAIKNEINKKC